MQHESNTSLHFAEHVIPNREKVKKGAALIFEGERMWKTYEEIVYDSEVFEEIGKEFEEVHPVKYISSGNSTCKLMSQRTIVDFAREWLIKRTNG